MGGLSSELVRNTVDVETERPLAEVELHLVRVLRVDLTVGEDGHRWPVIADGPAQDGLEARAIAVDAPDNDVHLAVQFVRSMPRDGGRAGARGAGAERAANRSEDNGCAEGSPPGTEDEFRRRARDNSWAVVPVRRCM